MVSHISICVKLWTIEWSICCKHCTKSRCYCAKLRLK